MNTTIAAENVKLCGVEWPPFTYSDNGLITKGISVDVYKEAFSRLKMTLQAHELPWPRCIKYVNEGIYDAVMDKRPIAPLVFGTYPTAVYPLAIYVRSDFTQEPFSWQLMTDKHVGMVRGYAYTDSIIQFKGWQTELSTTDEKILKMLQAKRYDYVVMDIFAAPILAKKLGISIKMLTPLIDTTYLYLGFNQKKVDLAEQYNTVIGDMIQDGTMDMIYQTYLPYSYTQLMKIQRDITEKKKQDTGLKAGSLFSSKGFMLLNN